MFWHLKFPERYQRELDSLRSLGATVDVNDLLLEQGRVCVKCILPVGGILNLEEPLQLLIVYPDLYPFFRPDVIAPDLDLVRHQNPQAKNLCLLARDTIAWEFDWTVGKLLEFQLKKVLIKGTESNAENLAQDREEQAEPISEYFTNGINVALFDTSSFYHLDVTSNNCDFLGKIKVGFADKSAFPESLAVLRITNPSGESTDLAPAPIVRKFRHCFEGSLYYIPEFLQPNNPDFFERLTTLLASSGRPFKPAKLPIKFGNIDLIGVLGLAFPEEITPGKSGIGWIFYCVGKKGKNFILPPLKTLRLNRSGHGLRVPKVMPLRDKTVAVIGLGALGGPAAIELARNGVGRLKLLDYDFVDPGTTIRWPLGIVESGNQKTDALADFIDQNYPSTKVEVFKMRLGEASDGKSESQTAMLDRFYEGASLIFDASVEAGIHSLVDYECKKKHIPYIIISATTGAFGGSVIRRIPGVTEGCYVCSQFAIGSEKDQIHMPPEEATDKIQSPGCGDVTFTGASFDLSEISIAGVRMAVSTLCYSEEGGYNLLPYDIGIVSMVDEKGLFDVPKWTTYKLIKHPSCVSCNS